MVPRQVGDRTQDGGFMEGGQGGGKGVVGGFGVPASWDVRTGEVAGGSYGKRDVRAFAYRSL